jgi:hypothetical protein
MPHHGVGHFVRNQPKVLPRWPRGASGSAVPPMWDMLGGGFLERRFFRMARPWKRP